MSKKVKVLISALVIAVLLTVGATATVMAEGEEETTPPPEASENALLARVADILGIDTEGLISAFEQTRQEMMGDAFINRLSLAVEEGLITREQADEIRKWRGQKPEVMEPGMLKHNLRSRIWSRFHLQNGSRAGFCPRLPGDAD